MQGKAEALEKLKASVIAGPNGCHFTSRFSYGCSGRVSIYANGRSVFGARLALEEKLGRDLTEGEFALHTCDEPRCINPDHLFSGSQSDNVRDMVSKGRAPNQSGENSASAKLSANSVSRIKSRYLSGGVTHRGLAAEYGVSFTTIGKIVRGERWGGFE